MVATQPVHGVQTRVVAVSKAHAPYRDGRFRRGDTIELSIRDTTMPPADALAYRVCITFPTLHDTRCQHASMDCFWPGDPVTFPHAANAVAVVRWYNRINLIAQRMQLPACPLTQRADEPSTGCKHRERSPSRNAGDPSPPASPSCASAQRCYFVP